MSTRKEPTLADKLIREYSTPIMRKWGDPTGWMLRNIAAARKFVLDEKMSAFSTDLAYAVLPKRGTEATPSAIRRANAMLEEVRHVARLPHKITWIEFDLRARINRAREHYGMPIHEDHGPDKGGWLMLQHEKLDTAFMAIECVSHSAEESPDKEFGLQFGSPYSPLIDRPNASPLAYAWTVDDTIPPWPLIGQAHDKHQYASSMLTGVSSYKVRQVGWAVAPWANHRNILGTITEKMFRNLEDQLASDLRYLWALLAAINDTPVSYRAVTPAKGHMVAGNYKRFSAHTVVTLQVPHKMDLKRLAKKVAIASRRRAHQVRGHFRKNWRDPDGPKMWIPEHQRGDASMGFVLHDYKVEHPA